MNEPKTRLTETETHITNLGARMAAAGFTEADSPFTTKINQTDHEAWLTGMRWFHLLRKYSSPVQVRGIIIDVTV